MPIGITALVPIILHRRQHFIKRAAIYDLNWPDISAPIYSKIQPHWNICWLSVKQYKVHFAWWTYSYHSVTRNSLSGDMNRQLRITLTISRTREYKVCIVFIRVICIILKLPSTLQTIDVLYPHSSINQSIPVMCIFSQ